MRWEGQAGNSEGLRRVCSLPQASCRRPRLEMLCQGPRARVRRMDDLSSRWRSAFRSAQSPSMSLWDVQAAACSETALKNRMRAAIQFWSQSQYFGEKGVVDSSDCHSACANGWVGKERDSQGLRITIWALLSALFDGNAQKRRNSSCEISGTPRNIEFSRRL